MSFLDQTIRKYVFFWKSSLSRELMGAEGRHYNTVMRRRSVKEECQGYQSEKRQTLLAQFSARSVEYQQASSIHTAAPPGTQKAAKCPTQPLHNLTLMILPEQGSSSAPQHLSVSASTTRFEF